MILDVGINTYWILVFNISFSNSMFELINDHREATDDYFYILLVTTRFK